MRQPVLLGMLLATIPAFVAAQQQPLAPLPPALPRTHAPRPTAAAITAADLMTRLYIFADDSMMGRETGTRGNAMGTTYLAAEVKRMGLRPAGDNGTFFQSLPDSNYHPVLASGVSMRVGTRALALGTDFLPIGTHGLESRALGVVFGGAADAPLTLTPAQAAGKLVVFTAPPAMGINAITVPHVAGARAVALVGLDSVPPDARTKLIFTNKPLPPQLDVPTVLLSSVAAQQLFGKAPHALTVGTTGRPVAVAYAFVSSARNVVAILPGSDPVLRHQYVAMGAHNDHIGRAARAVGDHDSLRVFTYFASASRVGPKPANRAAADSARTAGVNAMLATLRRLHPPRPDSIFNGADDDGSGSMTMLEIAEHLASLKVKPKRSVIFVWHTGEEEDLLGSALFTDHPTVPRDSIVAQLNADMIGRGNASDMSDGGPNHLEVVGARKLSSELGRLVDTVNQTGHHGLAIDHERGAPYYDASDHYNYAKHGIPIAFFFTGIHPDYHRVTDEPQYIDYTKMARIASLIDDIAMHVANLDHRLVVDHPTQ